MKTVHLSLGPTCVPAELLKASHLRTCSFGFDWFRSGSFFIEEFLKRPPLLFLERYVFNPCVPLRQNKPSGADAAFLHTIEPCPIKPLYGYSYLYNPHRDLSDPETKSYFYRAFERLRNVITDDTVFKRYILADYTNKEHASHLHEPQAIADWFSSISKLYKLSGELYIIRITLRPSRLFQLNIKEHSCMDGVKVIICNVAYWSDLDNEECRDYVYRKIGRSIFGSLPNRSLWRP